jgi:thiamine pyrophosphokinase
MIGDFDSYNPLDETIELCIANNPSFRFIRLSPDKDLSDLEYAVRYFLSLGYNITIVNNLQGRIDHILSSLYLLELGEDISISSASQDVFLAKNNFSISLPLDTTISLIPISKVVTQVKTHGLLYPLENETIYRANSRGLSNKNVDKNIDISFLDGRILVVINR